MGKKKRAELIFVLFIMYYVIEYANDELWKYGLVDYWEVFVCYSALNRFL